MTNQNQNMIDLSMSSSKLLLKESRESAKQIDTLLFACANAQKLYGREPEAFKASIRVIHSVLGDFPAEKVIKALNTWLQRSPEFPTPADLVSLIKRNGKPPIKESDIIAIRKKEVCDWTRAEAQLVEEWECQQQEGWRDIPDPSRDTHLMQENMRLRQRIKALEAENARAWTEAKKDPIAKPELSKQEQIDRTVQFMRQTGASQEDIDEFLNQQGIAA